MGAMNPRFATAIDPPKQMGKDLRPSPCVYCIVR
jgi:hypothetical protein